MSALTRRGSGRSLTRGQAMYEYSVVTAVLLGGTILGWPFLVQLINALNRYFQSLYYVIRLAL